MRTGLAGTVPEPVDGKLVAPKPALPTISRRGVLALVGGTSLAVFFSTVGEVIGGPARFLSLFGTHYRAPGVGANRFPVNHTAASVGVRSSDTGPSWRLTVVGARRVSISREQLLAMPLVSASLPIVCTEGWSTQQIWTGVLLSDLARLCGMDRYGATQLTSLDARSVTLSGSQVTARGSMLALRVNGSDLSLDHGFPARAIVPAAPGTHNLKWMSEVTFSEQA
jgi:hypothetical protein